MSKEIIQLLVVVESDEFAKWGQTLKEAEKEIIKHLEGYSGVDSVRVIL